MKLRPNYLMLQSIKYLLSSVISSPLSLISFNHFLVCPPHHHCDYFLQQNDDGVLAQLHPVFASQSCKAVGCFRVISAARVHCQSFILGKCIKYSLVAFSISRVTSGNFEVTICLVPWRTYILYYIAAFQLTLNYWSIELLK